MGREHCPCGWPVSSVWLVTSAASATENFRNILIGLSNTNTGRVHGERYILSMSMACVGKALHDNAFCTQTMDTNVFFSPVNTDREHGPCLRVVYTGTREHRLWAQKALHNNAFCAHRRCWWAPVHTTRKHGPCSWSVFTGEKRRSCSTVCVPWVSSLSYSFKFTTQLHYHQQHWQCVSIVCMTVCHMQLFNPFGTTVAIFSTY